MEPRKNPQAKLLRTIDKNTDTHLHALGFANDSLHMTPKALKTMKLDTLASRKRKKSMHHRIFSMRVKRQPREWQKMLEPEACYGFKIWNT